MLRELRKSLDLTQRAVADLVSCSELTIRKIENGTRRPSPQIAALLADRLHVPELQRAEFLTLARAKPGATDPRRQTNLPTPLGRLIGREDVLSELRALIVESRTRLLTLTGTAGIGKTRLAIQTGWGALPAFRDGVWYVALDSIAHADEVPRTIARTLRVEVAPQQSAAQSLLQALREKQLLLVLDNFEHVVPAAPFVAALLVECPKLAALVTSREALHVRGERGYSVPPLPVPDLSALPPVPTLAKNPAVALFSDAASSVAPAFSLGERNAAAVAQICVAVEGLPLAIELVAGHVKTISARMLAAQIVDTAGQSSLALLDHGPVDLPPRQRVLRTALTDSYRTLEPPHQETFARLGVFAGEFSIHAAHAVTGDGDTPAALAERLGALIEKSLLKRVADDGDEPRYVMLRAIREFAAECSSDATAFEAARRHAEYFLECARRLQSSEREEINAFRDLDAEYHNLRAALEWAVRRDQMELAVGLTTALWRFWMRRGHLDEGRQWLERVLNAQRDPDGARRAELLLAAATLARCQCDYAAATKFVEESLSLWRSSDDRRGIARALKEAGTLADCRGDLVQARSFLMESIKLFRTVDDDNGVASALGNLGIVEQEQGHHAAARRHHLESLALHRKHGNAWGVAATLTNLGLVARQLGAWDAASASWSEALSAFRKVGDQQNLAVCLNNLGMAELARGNLDRAARCHEETRELAEKLSDRFTYAQATGHLGDIALHRGDLAGAVALLTDSLRTAAQLDEASQMSWCLRRFADVAAVHTQWSRCVTLMSAARSILEGAAMRSSPADERRDQATLAKARSALTEREVERALRIGAAMSRERAVHFALLAEPVCGPGAVSYGDRDSRAL